MQKYMSMKHQGEHRKVALLNNTSHASPAPTVQSNIGAAIGLVALVAYTLVLARTYGLSAYFYSDRVDAFYSLCRCRFHLLQLTTQPPGMGVNIAASLLGLTSAVVAIVVASSAKRRQERERLKAAAAARQAREVAAARLHRQAKLQEEAKAAEEQQRQDSLKRKARRQAGRQAGRQAERQSERRQEAAADCARHGKAIRLRWSQEAEAARSSWRQEAEAAREQWLQDASSKRAYWVQGDDDVNSKRARLADKFDMHC